MQVLGLQPDKVFTDVGSWPTDGGLDVIWSRAAPVSGWLAESQALALHRAASLVPEGHWIVEIGSHHGRSTVFLASGKSDGVRMLAVDPFDNPRWGGGPESLAAFHHTLESFGLRGTVETFRGVSVDAASAWDGDAVGLLFVDGAHDRRSVLADIDGWEPFVAPGGLVFFHDAFSSIGVTEALTIRHLLNRNFRCVGSSRTLVGFEHVSGGAASTARNAVQMMGRYPYFARNIAIKLALRRSWAAVPRLLRYRHGDDLF